MSEWTYGRGHGGARRRMRDHFPLWIEEAFIAECL
jgi:hypothetical protein